MMTLQQIDMGTTNVDITAEHLIKMFRSTKYHIKPLGRLIV